MSLHHEFIEEAGYLHCKITGTYDNIWDSVEFFGQVLLHAQCSRRTDILYDTRGMTDYPSATEKVIYMSRIIDRHDIYVANGGKPLHIAFLGSDKTDQPYNPGLDVAASRGFSAIITSSLEAAISWFPCLTSKADSNWQKGQTAPNKRLVRRAT